MASASGDRIDLLAPDWCHPVTRQAGHNVSEDGGLVRAARDGDRAAFGQLYDRYTRMIHGILLARVPLHEVNDLVQDVFLTALSRLRSLREPSSFGAWLAAIARNRASDFYRHSRPEDPLEESDAPTELAYGNTDGDQKNLAAKILEIIKSLPDAYSETLILRLVEGMTGPEIAARTGMTQGSVRVNLHRGMQRLREKLGSRKQQSEQETP